MCFHLELHQKYLILARGNLKKKKCSYWENFAEILEFYASLLGLCPPVNESCSVPPAFGHFRASNTQQAKQLLMHNNEIHSHDQLIPLMFGQNNN